MTNLTIQEINNIVASKFDGRSRFLSHEFNVKNKNDLLLIFSIFSFSGNKNAKYFIDFSTIGNRYVKIRNETFRVPTFTILKRSW